MHALPVQARKYVRFPETGVTRNCELPQGYREPNLGPLAASLQPETPAFLMWVLRIKPRSLLLQFELHFTK